MLQVQVCVGSSCHLKGSYYIIETLQQIVKKYSLEKDIEIKAAFCLGNCTKGVSVKVDDEFIEEVTIANAEEKLSSCLLSKLR